MDPETIAEPGNTPQPLNRPRMVAVWPGMGHVGINAGIYLLAKLEMVEIAEFDPIPLFDAEAVEVRDGLIHMARRPRSRFFLWRDPAKEHDLVVFIGEAQPQNGKYAFCRDLVRYARGLGVERIFTFAAMATQMRPEAESSVYAAAVDKESLRELRQLELKIMTDGHIGGLNGVLLGAAGEAGLAGACLLGEMPHVFHQLPYPKASLAILEVFTTMTGLDIDMSELTSQAAEVGKQLGALLATVETRMRGDEEGGPEEEFVPEPPLDDVDPDVRGKIEELFDQAASDRSKAFELKRELDRNNLFKEYEDRFLDLFRTKGDPG